MKVLLKFGCKSCCTRCGLRFGEGFRVERVTFLSAHSHLKVGPTENPEPREALQLEWHHELSFLVQHHMACSFLVPENDRHDAVETQGECR